MFPKEHLYLLIRDGESRNRVGIALCEAAKDAALPAESAALLALAACFRPDERKEAQAMLENERPAHPATGYHAVCWAVAVAAFLAADALHHGDGKPALDELRRAETTALYSARAAWLYDLMREARRRFEAPPPEAE